MSALAHIACYVGFLLLLSIIEEVVALVQLREGASLTPRAIREFATRSVARFKAPQAALVCDRIGRHASGKADYTWARQAARDAAPATDDDAVVPLAYFALKKPRGESL